MNTQIAMPATLLTPDLSPGNHKLGELWNWSIPAILSCPGKSSLCEDLCYADRSFYYMGNVREKLFSNWTAARSPNFASWMVRRVEELAARVVRIHVAGDFFSAEYALAWGRVFAALPGVRFYYYTRSWRLPDIRQALESAILPNVRAWYSCDAETGKPAGLGRSRGSRVRLAYMLVDGESRPAFDADLLFRDKTYRPGERVKRVAGRLVCPAEQHEGQKATCDRCRLCFDDDREDAMAYRAPTVSEARTYGRTPLAVV